MKMAGGGGLRITEKEEKLKIREAKAYRNQQMYEEPGGMNEVELKGGDAFMDSLKRKVQRLTSTA